MLCSWSLWVNSSRCFSLGMFSTRKFDESLYQKEHCLGKYGFSTASRCDGCRVGIYWFQMKGQKSSKSAYTDREAKAGLKAKLPAIETFSNQFPDYEITIEIPEFTSICPKTGLPDFGKIIIHYVPKDRCLELKSLKMYILAYRNLGIFYENAVNRILKDVARACKPVRACVTGEFSPRGGLVSTVKAHYPRPKFE